MPVKSVSLSAIFAAIVVFAVLWHGSNLYDSVTPVAIPQSSGGQRIAGALNYDYNRRIDPNIGVVPVSRLLESWDEVSDRFPNIQHKGQQRTGDAYTWQQIDDFLPSLAITRMVYDPSDPMHFYFCTGEGWFNADASRGAGVWESEDGGVTWTRLISTDSETFYYCQDMAVHPFNSDIYVGTRTGGLQRSTDGGLSWSKVLGSGLGASRNSITDIEFTADGGIFVGIGIFETDGLYYSDSGDSLSWTKMSNGFPTSGIYRVEVATAASNSDVAYAIPVSTDNRIEGIYRTGNRGSSWTELSDPDGDRGLAASQGWYDLTLAVDPNDEDVVVAGGLHLWRSRDAGQNWQQLSAGRPDSLLLRYVHVDQHEIHFQSSDTVYFGNDGGIWKCDNFTAEVPIIYNRNEGYNVTQFYAAAIHPHAGNPLLIGGTQDNGTSIALGEGAAEYKFVSGADGSWCAIDALDPDFMYSSKQYQPVYRFSNGGFELPDTIENPLVENFNLLFINPFEMDPVNPQILYMATNRGLHRLSAARTASSAGWVKASKNIGQITAIGMGVDQPHTVIVGRSSANGEVFLIPGANHSDENTDPIGLDPNNQLPDAAFGAALNVSSVVIDTSDANHVIVTYSNFGITSVFESNNALSAVPEWHSVEGDLPDVPVNWALLHPDDPEVCYLATDLGVFYTDKLDGDNTVWIPCSGGIPNIRVEQLRYRPSDLTVVAATHGRGLWTAQLDPAAVSNDIAWEERGPSNVGGRTRTIMVDPNDPSRETVWAGSVSGGLWKTSGISSVGLSSAPSASTEVVCSPNPFGKSGVHIEWTASQTGPVQLMVMDLSGRTIDVLNDAVIGKGTHIFEWTPMAGISASAYLLVWNTPNQRGAQKLLYQP